MGQLLAEESAVAGFVCSLGWVKTVKAILERRDEREKERVS